MGGVTIREALPEVSLVDPHGRRVPLRALKPMRPAAIFLFHGEECAACRQRLREFAAAADRYARIPAAVIAVSLDPGAELGGLARDLQLGFTLAHDPDGRLSGRFSPPDPGTGERAACCIVADAFGEIFAVLRGEDAVAQDAILDWLDFIEVQCPE